MAIHFGEVEANRRSLRSTIDWRRFAPVTIAAAIALAYVLVSPPSGDLAAHMFRTRLFSEDPFGFWNNYWYSGHHAVGYSLLFPAAAAALTPQIVAALAATGSAALFGSLAFRRFGSDAWLGVCVFAAATAVDLFTGRLAFAFGVLPALAAVVALDRGWTWTACACALISALCSPVAALFAALAGAAYLIGERRPAGAVVAIAALVPIGATALLFPEGGTEPFALSALWPIPLLTVGALAVLPAEARVLRAGVVIYVLVTFVSYTVATPLGSNAARLGTLLAAPLAALILWPRRVRLLVLVALPLLYLEWQAPVRDLVTASGDPSVQTGYYQPVLAFLERQPGASGRTFRVEIPFTRFHWEAYVVGSRFPLARGWERQLDTKDNALFYDGRLTASSYDAWLHRTAVRYVAAPDAQLDYSAEAEMRLIDRGLPYLHLVLRTAHWRVYAVRDATPIAQGTARLQAIGPDWVRLYASRPGTTLLRVHFTPYWAIVRGSGCVAPAGDLTKVTLRRAGEAELAMRFAVDRIGASSSRCS
jgi:hypothetical protein